MSFAASQNLPSNFFCHRSYVLLLRSNIFLRVSWESLCGRIHRVDFNDFDSDIITYSKVPILPADMLILGNQQASNMQMQTFLLSTNVVDDCRKHACVTDTSATQTLTVDIYFKCSHGRYSIN
jgi:hypothetical protein